MEKKAQISGPPPVVSYTILNHEILTILTEIKISLPPTPFLPKLQIFIVCEKKTDEPSLTPNLSLQKNPKHLTNSASFTEKKLSYPNLINAQLTQPK